MRRSVKGCIGPSAATGSFCRVIPLPEGAITENAKATFRDGVLEITMPAPPAARGRRLEITGEAAKK